MKEKTRTYGKILLLFAFAISSFFIRPVVAEAAVTIEKQDMDGDAPSTSLIQEGSDGKQKSLVGQYTLTETGDTNFYTGGGGGEEAVIKKEMTSKDQKANWTSVIDEISADGAKMQNSSIAALKATNSKCTIKKAYLVWECSVQSKNSINKNTQKAANAAIYFAKSGQSVKKVTAKYASIDNRAFKDTENNLGREDNQQYSFLCMYADVTTYVAKYGYGTYGVANIPWESSGKSGDDTYVEGGWGDGHGGESISAWQLIVVEENPKVNVRAIAVTVGSQFNRVFPDDADSINHSMDMDIDFRGFSSKSWVDKNTKLTGQVLCISEPSIGLNKKTYKNFVSRIYDKKKNKDDSGIFDTEYLSPNEILVPFSVTSSSKSKAIGFGTTAATGKLKHETAWLNKSGKQVLESEVGNKSTDGWTELDAAWTTLFVYGVAIDMADYEMTDTQTTTVTSAKQATVSGTLTVNTDQDKTGYIDGTLTIQLDDALTPSAATFKVYDNRNPKKPIETTLKYEGKTVTSEGLKLVYDSKNHILKLSGIENRGDASYVDYDITCKVQANSGKSSFENSYSLVGTLFSQDKGTTVEKLPVADTSTAVPKYTITIKMDKTTMSKVAAKKGKSSASGKLGTVNSSSTASGNYYTASYDVTYNYYISAAPTFKSGYEFSLWEELNEKDSTTKERKTSSGYVNDTTYAYERQMPAYNITLTITGVGEKYEVRYYMNAPVTIADTDKWKVGESFTLIGNSAKETAAKTYTGAQIKKICGKTAPYIYKTYQFGNYYSASKSSGITIKGYENVIDGTHTKDGWWTAASGGSYVDIDGAASGDNAGKIQIDAAWKKLAKDGTLSDGTKGKIICLYAHWEKRIFKVTLVKGIGVEKVSGAGTYTVGDKVKISADLKTGYHWQNWTGNYASGTIADQTFTFTMPAQDVTLTANAEINSYTLHFDPNTGTEVTHIDDIEVTYDGQVTLPDATGCYARYTLDGQDITSQVISGEIRLAADGRVLTDEEETETEEEDNGNQDDIVESESSETIEDNDVSEADMEAVEGTESVDVESVEDTELALETEQKAAEATKRAYASVYTGWSLEDSKNNYTPQWGYGIQVDVAKIIDAAGMTGTDGATITLYANWDDCPWIVANDLYYTLEQAQSGFITMDEILSHATASDREDGSPILPGTNQAESNPELFTSFTIPDYSPTDFTQFTHEGSCTENLTVTDSAGSTYAKQITVYVVDTTPVAVKPDGTTRFISEKYFNADYEHGGLAENSIWKTDAEYTAALQEAFDNLKNDTPEMTFYFTHDTILSMKEYITEHGFGNIQEEDALQNFYDTFMAPNKVE